MEKITQTQKQQEHNQNVIITIHQHKKITDHLLFCFQMPLDFLDVVLTFKHIIVQQQAT